MNEIEFERGVELLVDKRLVTLDLLQSACSPTQKTRALKSQLAEINEDVDLTMSGLSIQEMNELDLESRYRTETIIRFREQIDIENFSRNMML